MDTNMKIILCNNWHHYCNWTFCFVAGSSLITAVPVCQESESFILV